METPRFKRPSLTTTDITLSAALAAVFVVSTFFPVDAFIGGAGIITFEIILVPVIAFTMRPVLAAVTISIGAVAMALLQGGTTPAFGILGILVPIIATVLGSVAFHYRYGPILPWAYVLSGAVYYLGYSKGGTTFWLIPYIIVIISLPAALSLKEDRSVALLAFYTAMAEQVTLNVLSIGVVGLVGGIWAIITPFMLLERTIATVGSYILIVGLKRGLGARLPSQEYVRR